MPLNDRKMISIILEECNGIEERCAGYRKAIIDLICDILEYERGHRVSATTIQKKINDKCNAAGQFLAMEQSKDARAEELRP